MKSRFSIHSWTFVLLVIIALISQATGYGATQDSLHLQAERRKAQLDRDLSIIMPPKASSVQKLSPEQLDKMSKLKAQAESTQSALSANSPQTMSTLTAEESDYYAVVDLGDLGGDMSYANKISPNGKIVGFSTILGGNNHAFLYINGVLQNLGVIGSGSFANATGVNDNDQVVGYASGLASLFGVFLYENGSINNLGLMGGYTDNFAEDMNSSGEMTGRTQFSSAGYYSRAYLYSGGVLHNLGTLGGISSVGWGINDVGQVVGSSYISPNNSTYHAFLYSQGVMQDLGTLGGSQSQGKDLNNNGHVVGGSKLIGNSVSHAFVYANGNMEDIGTLEGDLNSEALGINSAGKVVGYSTGSEGQRAFIYSSGTMKNLNNFIAPNSGWLLKEATAINDRGQIVGFGTNAQGKGHAFLLNPVPKNSKQAIETEPQKEVYAGCIEKQGGKDSLVVITHGWIDRILSPLAPSNPAWIDSMSNAVSSYLTLHEKNNWQVYGYLWVTNAWTVGAPGALHEARGEGQSLGDCLALQGWANIHLVAHSAGANLIQTATEWIKAVSPGTTVHCTFLDPFVGNDYAGVANYGAGADWSDNYFSKDFTGNRTGSSLLNAYNVDVTQLGEKHGVTRFRSQESGQMEICTQTYKYHGWPHEFYLNTILGNVTSEYAGFGFPLSKEGGNWSVATNLYQFGALTNLGTPDPECFSSMNINPPAPIITPANFLQLPEIWRSSTGNILKGNGWLKMDPGSPVWLGMVIVPTNPINLVSFDAQFLNMTNGSESMLSVYWDSEVIGTIDQRMVLSGLKSYKFKFPNVQNGSSHVLGIRLDPFTNALTSVLITNAVLSSAGVSKPFSVVPTTNKVSGLQVWELIGESGYEYTAQVSSNLLDWVDMAELANTNGRVRFVDQDSTNHTRRFYRAIGPE